MSDDLMPQCACGDPHRSGLDHNRFVCVSQGLFTEEDFDAIEKAAEGGDGGGPRHQR